MTRFRSNPGADGKMTRLRCLRDQLRRQEYRVDTKRLIEALIRPGALRQVERSHQRSTIRLDLLLQ
jgi:hypothetical protein